MNLGKFALKSKTIGMGKSNRPNFQRLGLTYCANPTEENFTKLYNAMNDKLIGFAYGFSKDREVVREGVSLTWEVVLKEGPRKFSSARGAFTTWIYTICRNKTINMVKQQNSTTYIRDIAENYYKEDYMGGCDMCACFGEYTEPDEIEEYDDLETLMKVKYELEDSADVVSCISKNILSNVRTYFTEVEVQDDPSIYVSAFADYLTKYTSYKELAEQYNMQKLDLMRKIKRCTKWVKQECMGDEEMDMLLRMVKI